ncbi:hypothetical protein [Curtobacterium sp. MCBA15_004]|uniref:hypothetical protein n=1 Tax=Curtobacterium sp. MCBA15_004 TaxID=1898733 RepID=UPI0008DE7B37|nr:hypothetical protein [Curtobacterium sp. MCBA15_004]WIA96416.1 hypothetical protein QOL16_15160 [Curtobacterium sp. MCBA15_004]WIA97627.1 hypothetical protein QOL16_04325 [Curtobacterium sp. MCBA15_004]
MRVVGDSGTEFELEDTVATSMIAAGHLAPVDPDDVEATATGVAASDEDRLGLLEDRVTALEALIAFELVPPGPSEGEGEGDGEPDPEGGTEPASGEQSGPVKEGEPETGPATDEAQDILHDTKPPAKRTRARQTDTDKS